MEHREGELYKTLIIGGRTFTIRYGYYAESERTHWPPTPIYPDFARTPVYTTDGAPFVTAAQDVCPHYVPVPHPSGENWCHDCTHFSPGDELIGICRCPARRSDDRQNE